MKKFLFVISLFFYYSNSFSQGYSYGQQICQTYIQNGKSSTENKIDNGIKTGFWTIYYDENDSIVNNKEKAISFQIINLKNNSPIGLGCFCSGEGRLEGYSKYLNDTTWTLDSTSVWFDGKGRVESKMIYQNDTLIKFEGFSTKGYLNTSEDYTYLGNDTITILKYYRADGSVIIFEEQLNGTEHGKYNIYYPNGNSKVAAFYEYGFRVIDASCYKNGATKTETRCYAPGKPCDCKKFDKDGNIIKEYKTKSKIVEKWTR